MYTKGKWEISEDDDQRVICGHKDIAAAINVWSTDPKVDMKDGECEANARLIAAAPELLEALEKIAEEAKPGQEITLDDAVELLASIYTISTSTTAKAKGESC